MSAPRLIVLTGPPGAGKTTVARLVAESIPLSVHLRADDFWSFITRGWVPPWEPHSQRQNETVIAAVGAAAQAYAAGGYTVIVDGIVGPWFLDDFCAAIDVSLPVHYVVLRPSREVTLSRATARGRDALVDEAPVRHMYEQFTVRMGDLAAHVVDSSEQIPEATAALIATAVRRGDYLLERGATGGSRRRPPTHG